MSQQKTKADLSIYLTQSGAGDSSQIAKGANTLKSFPIRIGTQEIDGHWAGLVASPVTYVVDRQGKVRWAYVSSSAADRPSPVALAKAAVSIVRGKDPSPEYPGKM